MSIEVEVEEEEPLDEVMSSERKDLDLLRK